MRVRKSHVDTVEDQEAPKKKALPDLGR